MQHIRVADYITSPREFVVNRLDANIDRGLCELEVSDGIIQCSLKKAYVNILFWQVLMRFGIAPVRSDFVEIINISSKTVPSILTKHLYALCDRYGDLTSRLYTQDPIIVHMEILNACWISFCDIKTVVNHYTGAYVATMDAVSLYGLCDLPEMQKIVNPGFVKGMSTLIAEGLIKHATDEFNKVVGVRGVIEDNPLIDFMEPEILNQHQIPQMMIAYGPRSDLDNTMMQHIITASTMSGCNEIKDYFVETLSAKKSSYFTKTLIRETQYFGRKLRLSSLAMQHIYPGSCGQTKGVTYVLPAMDKNNKSICYYFGKRMLIDGNEVVLTAHNCKDYAGKAIEFITPFMCRHRDGICEHCLGLDVKFPILFFPPGIHIGMYAASKLAAAISQRVLSNKHLVKTVSKIYSLNPLLKRYLELDETAFRLNHGLKVHQAFLGIQVPLEAFQNPISDLILGSAPNPTTFSKVSALNIVGKNMETGKWDTKDTLYLELHKLYPYFSKEFLLYVRNNYNRLDYDNNAQTVVIPMDWWNLNNELMRYIVMNEDVANFAEEVDGLFRPLAAIKRKLVPSNEGLKLCQCNTITEAVQRVAGVLHTNSSLEILYIEIILRSFLLGPDGGIPIVEDPNNVVFGSMREVLSERALSTKLSYEDVFRFLKTATAYTKPKPRGLYDAFFGFLSEEMISGSQR